jgi:hypothetical protein
MVNSICLDTPCSIEEAVQCLRALVRLLGEEPDRADEILEAFLIRRLEDGIGLDPDAVSLKALFLDIRPALRCAPPRPPGHAGAPVTCLPYVLREALLLHRVARLSARQIGNLIDEPASAIHQRISQAEDMTCGNCQAFAKDLVAA